MWYDFKFCVSLIISILWFFFSFWTNFWPPSIPQMSLQKWLQNYKNYPRKSTPLSPLPLDSCQWSSWRGMICLAESDSSYMHPIHSTVVSKLNKNILVWHKIFLVSVPRKTSTNCKLKPEVLWFHGFMAYLSMHMLTGFLVSWFRGLSLHALHLWTARCRQVSWFHGFIVSCTP